jgi:hypothetical protein
LLLKELIKVTPKTHPDYQSLEKSLNLIQDVATHLNEERRKKDFDRVIIVIKKKFPRLFQQNDINSKGMN